MDRDYYKSYYQYERSHWWFKARSKILADYIDVNVRKGPLKILNVGVATGATTTMLRKFGTVTSLEYDQGCIDFVKDKVDFDIVQGSILELPFDSNEFDLVCAFDVIEHVDDDAKAVEELARVCRSEGHVIVSVPAFMKLWSEHDEINHHFRRYVKSELIALFKGIKGGQVSFCSYFNFFFFPLIFLVRRLSGLAGSKRELRSDFEKFTPGILNSVLFKIMETEKYLITSRKTFPVGVSLVLDWEKTGKET